MRSALFSPFASLALFAIFALFAAFVVAVPACSKSGASGTGGDAADGGDEDASCGPAPESFALSSDDCVAASPNPCCPGFTLFRCSGDAGASCSETASCVRAARYDLNVCNGGLAYSCPQLAGTNAYATLTGPECVQVDSVPQNGEGPRWCCGGSGIEMPAPDASPEPESGADSGVEREGGAMDASLSDDGAADARH
jgi:hypothetical protein